MKTRLPGIIAILCLIPTLLWIIILVKTEMNNDPLETFEQILTYISKFEFEYYMSYISASLITILVTMFFASLYHYCKNFAPQWSMTGIVFIPIYAVFNLFVYLSQITIVPRLLRFEKMNEYKASAILMLQFMVQLWGKSGAAFLNIFAYAILGIPSVIFGCILYKSTQSLKMGAIFLILNGIACIAGFLGLVLENAMLGIGTIIGAVFFTGALLLTGIVFLTTDNESNTSGNNRATRRLYKRNYRKLQFYR